MCVYIYVGPAEQRTRHTGRDSNLSIYVERDRERERERWQEGGRERRANIKIKNDTPSNSTANRPAIAYFQRKASQKPGCDRAGATNRFGWSGFSG